MRGVAIVALTQRRVDVVLNDPEFAARTNPTLHGSQREMCGTFENTSHLGVAIGKRFRRVYLICRALLSFVPLMMRAAPTRGKLAHWRLHEEARQSAAPQRLAQIV